MGNAVAELQRRADRIFSTSASDVALGDDAFLAALHNVERNVNPNATNNATEGERREFNNQTSVVVDPPDGRIPYTPQGQARFNSLLRSRVDPPSDPEALSNEVRCVTYEVARLRGGPLTYLQLVQALGYVVVVMESINEVRIIPLEVSTQLPSNTKK